MPGNKPARKKYVNFHHDGSIWAKGYMLNGKPDGYFEWFRKDGSKMRSGYFSHGKQVGEWTTYDQSGHVVKVTKMK
jgi:antitoxin component YwqK of YwqJK toxin-antitoxin module